MDRKEKFLEKNKDNILKFDEMMSNDNVVGCVVSTEIGHFIRYLPLTVVNSDNENYITYNNKQILVRKYQEASTIRFLKKNDSITFNIPCVCGIYSDEPHEHNLK